MNREVQETRLDEAEKHVDRAIVAYETGNYELATAALNDAFAAVDEVMSAQEDESDEYTTLRQIADDLENLDTTAETVMSEDDIKEGLAEIKQALSEFEFSE